MNRQTWRDVAEAIGFLAVIASLVFVGIETRNSTKQSQLTTQALEISAYQALMSNIDDLNMLLFENPSMAPVMDEIWGGRRAERMSSSSSRTGCYSYSSDMAILPISCMNGAQLTNPG